MASMGTSRQYNTETQSRYPSAGTMPLHRGLQTRTPLALLLGAAGLILVCTIILLAYMANQRSEEAMARLLAEKGSSLIMAFEGSVRSGMRSRAGLRLQILLEEMSSSPDIIFIALAMPDGTIVAHSDHTRLGEILFFDGRELDTAQMAALAPAAEARWGMMRMEGQRAFVVYRQFAPGLQNRVIHFPLPVLFLGLDVSPFEITRKQNRDYMLMLTAVMLLVGLLCLLALYYAERARQWRQGQHLAEDRLRQMEEEMRRKEKLAAIGNLAAGVAHEIRNPLSSIKGYATYFGQRFPEGSADRDAAVVMVNEVERLNRVITDLIGLSQPSDILARPVNLADVLQHVARLVKADATERGVRIVCRIGRKIPMALADPERMEQAVLNLCLNALDAMPEGGVLTLVLVKRAQRVGLLVADNGVGIEAEVLQYIFDPYFTSKAQGTGLGLAITHKIVEAHQGEISVTSRQARKGRRGKTVFSIWLPQAPPEESS